MTSGPTKTRLSSSEVEHLCRTHLALVKHEVRALASRLPQHVNHDDLVSAGMAGLASAALAFDPSLGVPFGSFAVRRVRGALLDELRSADWASRSIRTRVRSRDLAHDAVVAMLGRNPTTEELAAHLGVDVSELVSLEADVHRSVVLSVDRLTAAGDAAEALHPASPVTPESVALERERQRYLDAAVQALPDRLKAVVVGYYLQDRPMKEIADELDVSESRVSQMRAEALRLLKHGMNSQLAPELIAPAESPGGVVARRREAYCAEVAARASYRTRLSVPLPRQAVPATVRTA